MIYYQDDFATLHLGKCEDVLPTLDAASIDAVICDPPYGTTACAWDTPIAFDFMWRELKRVTKSAAAIVLFGSQPFTSALVMSNPGMFRYSLVWDKVNKYTGYQNANRLPMRRHEDILVFAEGLTTYNKQFRKGKAYRTFVSGNKGAYLGGTGMTDRWRENDGDHNPCSIIEIEGDIKLENGLHPTQKPIALLEYLILTYTNPGDTVLDFTSGSGTTPVAAKKLGRKCIAIEQELEYCEVTVPRLYQNVMQFEVQS